MSLHVTVSLVAFLCYGGLLAVVFHHGLRENRPGQIFSLYLFDMVLMQIVFLMLSLADNAKEALRWYTLFIPISSGQPIIYFFFTRTLLGLRQSRRLVQASILAWLLIAVFCTSLGQRAIYTDIYWDETAGLFVPEFGPLMSVLAVHVLLFLSVAVWDLFRRYRSTKSPLQRVRVQYLSLGVFVVWGGMIANAFPTIRPYPVDVMANIMSAFLIAYAILRYQLLDINLVLRKGLLYFISATILGAGYFLIIYLATRLFQVLAGPQIFFLSFAVAVVAAAVVQPLHSRAQHWVDRIFFREKYDGSVMIQRLSRTATSVLDLNKLTSMILDDITKTMHIQWAALFLEQDKDGFFRLMIQRGLNADLDLDLGKDHPILRWLSSHEKVMTTDDLDEVLNRRAVQRQKADELEKVGVELLIPLRARGKLIGVLGLGPKLSQQSYSQDDEFTLTTLANQVAVAIDNARLYEAIQQELAERKRAEAEILRLQNRLQNVTDSMPSALIALNPDGRVLLWNPAAEALTGQTTTQVQGQLLWQACSELAHYRDLFERTLREGQVEHRHKEKIPSATGVVYHDVSAFPMVADEIEGVVLRIDDVTQRVKLEELMLQSAKMASIGGLAAGVAHEINNPLGVMMQSAQVLQMTLDPSRPRVYERLQTYGVDPEGLERYLQERGLVEYLDGIRTAGGRAAKIVADLLGFSRQTSSDVALHDLNTLVEQTLELAAVDYDLKKKYDFRDIEIVREFAPNLPSVTCDGQQVKQVVLNLVRNAAQAMAGKMERGDRDGDGEYRPRLVVRTLQREEWVRLEVEDNGPGIPEAVRGRLFEPFFTTKDVGEGTGLGLWLCWSIVVERHQGRVWAESVASSGTCFVVELPIA